MATSPPDTGTEPVMIDLFVHNEEQMLELGKILGQQLFQGAIIGLTGPLGAGKTTLARGIAEGMGLDEEYIVSSPTYTIMQNYPCGSMEMCHLDLYRIEGVDDLDSTGYRDATGEGRVLIVEWPEREPSVLPPEHLVIHIDYVENEDQDLTNDDGHGERKVSFRPAGKCYVTMTEKISNLLQDP